MDKHLEIESVNLECTRCGEKISQAFVCSCSIEGVNRYIYFCSVCKEPIAVKSYPRAFEFKKFNQIKILNGEQGN